MPLDVTLIESTSADFPAALRHAPSTEPISQVWAIGNLALLNMPLLGLFCSTRCPGNIILRTYDLALALREAGVPVVSGFHTPMERECLDVLLRGQQPVVLCPARGIHKMRAPAAWRQPLAKNRLLILSPFAAPYRRPTTEIAEQRNRFVAALADTIFVAHAAPGSKTARLCIELMALGKRLYTLDLAENASLMQHGVIGTAQATLVEAARHSA